MGVWRSSRTVDFSRKLRERGWLVPAYTIPREEHPAGFHR